MSVHLGAVGQCRVGWRWLDTGSHNCGGQAWDSTDLKEVHRVGGLKEGLHLAGGGGGRLKEGRSKVR